MCGLAGFLNAGVLPAHFDQIARGMSDRITHRGPDDSGVWTDAESGVALAHRRLSILDLSPAGHQPMHSASERFVLVFNGEIYNHHELRAELNEAGTPQNWRGHSDTETLLAGFSVWGVTATLQRAVGMFAIALWDRQERCLTLARDRLGEKPLYYGWVRGAFVFGSELKALRAYPGFNNPIDRNALALYTQFCTVPAPYSIYKNIFKLKPGNALTVSAKDLANVKIDPYWSFVDVVRQGLSSPFENDESAISCLDAALKQAVSEQSVADVPLGAFLSGGVDSSTIVALMQAQSSRPIETFTVGFEEAEFDESAHALAVAKHLGTAHHTFKVTSADAQAVIPLLPSMYDEPFADSSQIPTHLVSKAARTRATVALSGDGGDELFGGYNRYFWSRKIWSRIGWLPFPVRKALAPVLQSIPIDTWDALGRIATGSYGIARVGDKVQKFAGRMKHVDKLDDLYRSLVTEWPQSMSLVLGANRLDTELDDVGLTENVMDVEHRMMLLDTLTYLPNDILTKVDRASMSVSLETRVPFLDHRVVDLAWRMPLHMKIREGQGKWVLRQVLYKYVPRELIERPKAGFGIPIGAWLRGPMREWAEALLNETRLQKEGYFNSTLIRQAWIEHLSGKHDWSIRLWCILMFQAWLEENP